MIDNPFFDLFWKPGSIVKLKEPHKPEAMLPQLRRHIADLVIASKQHGIDRPPFYEKENLLVLQRQRAYREEWHGFTHGIIVQVVAHEAGRGVTSVSLHLYDPALSLIYCDRPSGIPTYVEMSVDELIPYKQGDVVGYQPIGEQ